MSRPRDDYEYQKNRGVVLREQPTCTVCNRQPSTQVDHIIPLDAGGGHELANLRGICFKCNNTLGHRYVTQRNEIRRTIRAEAMRQHGITDIDTKQKRFFTEKNLITDILELRFGAKLMRSYGRNQVTMPDGSKWFIRAANQSVGHGMSCDLIVADEIWDIGSTVIDGGLLPAQRARRSPLLSAWSTAGTEASTAMQRWREQGLRSIDRNEPSSLYFAEWSPPPDLSPMTAQAWAYANPALGKTLTLKTIEAESENPDRASFLRASCNLWVA
jgi:hypothetical protein